MPQGKGVLRIAIEDFLETFDMSNVFENLLGKLGRLLLTQVLSRYVKVLDEVATVSDMPIMKELSNLHSSDMNFFEKAFMLIFMLAAIVGSFGNAVTQPFGRLVTYHFEKGVYSSRIPPSTFIDLLHRFPEVAAKFKDDLLEQGFSPDRVDAMHKAYTREIELGLAVNLYWRGEINYNQYAEMILKQGLRPEAANQILAGYAVIPNVSDLIRMAVREAFSPDVIQRFKYDEAFPQDVLQYTKKLGLSDDWAKRYWYAHWELPSPQMGYEMLHRLRANRSDNPFTEDDLDLLLRTADFAPYFRERMKAISYNPITRVDIRRIYKLGLFDAAEVKERYMDIGYTDKDAQTLADFTVKYEDANGNDLRDKYKDLSFAILRSLYIKGKLSESEVVQRLTDAKYDPIEIPLIIDYFKLSTVDTSSVDYKAQFVSEMVKYVSDAYQVQMISEAEAKTTLIAIGISDANIDYILQRADYVSKLDVLNITLKKIHDAYTSGALSRNQMIAELGKLGISGMQQNKVIQEMELDIEYPNKRLSEAQYRAAALANMITENDYRERLKELGYAKQDIELLVKLYLSEGA